MIEHQEDVVVSSRVRLARNYDDLPFSTLDNIGLAALCVSRAKDALNQEGLLPQYKLLKLDDMTNVQRTSLVEEHLISQDLTERPTVGAVLLRNDQRLSIMMNEEDHLRIQAIMSGGQLSEAAELAFSADDALQKHVRFAFDSQLGFLTSCPTNTGTGMRASLMLHLPLLTICKQMGTVSQSIAKVGLTIRGIYGEGSEALGNLYQVSNQVTLGRTENEIVEAVIAVGRQLIDMERKFRAKALDGDDSAIMDQVFRAYGTLKYARMVNGKELMHLWSGLRLGAAIERLPLTLARVDALLPEAQDAHILKEAGQDLTANELNVRRADMIRAWLDEGGK